MKLFILLVSWAVTFLGISYASADGPLTLHILSKPQEKGEILVAVFAADKGFPYEGKNAVRLAKCKPVSGKCTVVIDQLPAGRYAVSVFQDRNNDEKFNTNFLGIPQEGYGVSNNAISTFRAPTFDEAAFQHNASTKLDIKLSF